VTDGLNFPFTAVCRLRKDQPKQAARTFPVAAMRVSFGRLMIPDGPQIQSGRHFAAFGASPRKI